MNISVIAPVLNEARILPSFLNQLSDLPVFEVILVDGGSIDPTPAILQSWVCGDNAAPSSPPRSTAIPRFVQADHRGRGNQMNAGAKIAGGDLLLFLHADSMIPRPYAQWIKEILRAMQDPDVVGGAFRLEISSPSFFLKYVSKAANLRSALLGLPYGDQGIFVRSDIFKALGGYPDWPLMEDVHFVRQLKKRGKTVLLKTALATSARRWDRGPIARSLRNSLLLALYFMGVCPARLARWYD